ncbi:unnamed protein product [Ixodes persulcatus]
MWSPTKPFLFLLQVCKPFYCCKIKSNYLCLVVLPCPGVLCECLAGCFDAFCLFILLLSGDVELNPGPTVSEQLETIILSQRDMVARLVSIEQRLEQPAASANERLTTIGHRIEALPFSAQKLEQCEATIESLKFQVVTLLDKVDDLKNRSHRNNLFVYGVNEEDNETLASIKKAVIEDLFKSKMVVKVASVERIHRLGKKVANKSRPVIIKFFDYNEKMLLMKNAPKLKGTKISVSEDYSRRVQAIRKQLWQTVKDNRTPDDKIFFRYDKLTLNNDVYAWDHVNNTRIKVTSARAEK